MFASSSSWQLPPIDNDPAVPHEQRRLRHLSSILIRNLTHSPRLHTLSSHAQLPPLTPYAADDTDLYFRSKRRRATSNASLLSVGSARTLPSEWVDAEGGAGDGKARSMRRSASGGITEPPPPVMRRRSTSRASMASAGSGSTIRMAHRREEVVKEVERETGTSYTSEAQLGRDKARRVETLRKRLVDSFVSLHLVHGEEERRMSGDSGRRRADSTIRPGSVKGKGRTRTLSTPLLLGAATMSRAEEKPFFVSSPQLSTMHPSFDVDKEDFLVDEPEEWKGMREGRVLVRVWTREGEEGKGKAREGDWGLLVEWDVDLSGLVSLGGEPSSFPPLLPNTLIFRLHDKYFTAPLPSRDKCDSGDEDEDEGNQSDPGTSSSLAHNAVTKRKKRELAEASETRRRRKEAVEKSVRETRMVKGAGVEAIVRLFTLQQVIEDIKASVAQRKKKMDAPLEDPDGLFSLEREKAEIVDRVDDLEAVQGDGLLDLEEEKAEISSRQEALRARRGRLKAARDRLAQERDAVATSNATLLSDDALCISIRTASHTRRTQLITFLSHIFPIEPAPSSPESSLLFTIVGLPLPNSSYSPSMSDEVLSSALGYAAQVVFTLAGYLGVPLHYPIKSMGSRSAVLDPISMMRGPRAFPLYARGVDRYRFDYGVFLLNKNIEQLMYSQGLMVFDLRNTLPNLKSLILLLSYDPSHADFSSSTFAASPLAVTSSPSPSPSLSCLCQSSASSPAPDALASTSDQDSDASDDEPRTVRAHSVRSTSPASTLKGGKLGNADRANENGVEKALPSLVVQDETGKANGKGKMGSLRGAWRVGAVGL